MAITNYSAARLGSLTTVTVASSLSAPVVYHWYVDGEHVGRTEDDPSYTFRVPPGEQVRILCRDTNDADADPDTLAPSDQAPATRRLWWVRSLDTDVDHYRVEQQQDAGDWELLATILHESSKWSYEHRTGRLDDLSDYAWRIVPVDAAGNHGDVLALEAEQIVRTPDAPVFSVAFDADTDKITWSES